MKLEKLLKISNNAMEVNFIKELMLVVMKHFSTKRSRSSMIKLSKSKTSQDLLAPNVSLQKKLTRKYSWPRDLLEVE